MKNTILVICAALLASLAAAAQPPRDSRPSDGRPGQGPRSGGWVRELDTNQNGSVNIDEFKAAADRTFAELDRNGDGLLQAAELHPMNGPDRRGEGPEARQRGAEKRLLPPFFFLDAARGMQTASRGDFDRITRAAFDNIDKNGDGVIDAAEAGQVPPPPPPIGPPPPPNAQFVGAEMRFGDKVVSGQPFSAGIEIEDTRMLMDGTMVKKTITGSVYRDGAGRVRREQPLGDIGGVNILGTDKKPQQLIFITDPVAGVQYFLDQNSRSAHTTPFVPNAQPDGADRPDGGKAVDDGTKTIEGVSCQATRTEHEIPAGEIGNQKPLEVVAERCFSPELQLVIAASHRDPIHGIHTFRLVNIKRVEPSPGLFKVPADYRVQRGGRN